MRKKILVVDNNPLILQLMTDLLREEGHQVLTSQDGVSALGILKTYIPDVIFIDLIMPNIDGKKLCQIIRRIPRLKNAFLVILSAIAAEEQVDIAKLGADAYIAKGPFTEMTKHILAVLDQPEQRRSDKLSETIRGLEGIFPREITKELLSTKRHFETVLGSMSEGILEITSAKTIVYANPAAISLTGVAEEKLLGTTMFELFNKPDRERIEGLLRAVGKVPQTSTEELVLNLNKKLVSMIITPVNGHQHRHIVILNDITARKRAEEALKESEIKYRTLFESSREAIMVATPEEGFLGGNFAALKMFACKDEREFVSMTPETLSPEYQPDGTVSSVKAQQMMAIALEKGSHSFEWKHKRMDETTFFASVLLAKMELNNATVIQATVRDITENKLFTEKLEATKKELEKINQKLQETMGELQKLTIIDGLTGIANRRHFDQVLATEWRRALRTQEPLSLILSDIDFFKNYNDCYGHLEGDDCLKRVATVLSGVARRPGDLVARYGGEEFAIILPDTASKNASKLAEKIRTDIESLKIHHRDSLISDFVTLSLGVASAIPTTDSSPERLIVAADKSLYRAKSEGRNRVILFNEMITAPSGTDET